jgi:hypothetical protein
MYWKTHLTYLECQQVTEDQFQAIQKAAQTAQAAAAIQVATVLQEAVNFLLFLITFK